MVTSKRWVSSAWRRYGLLAMVVSPLTTVACAAPSPERESSASTTSDALPAANPAAAPRLKAATRIAAPRVAQASIRAISDTYEVEVQSPSGFSPRAFDPVLRIGDKEFSNYRESTSVGEYGAVFRVERKDFDALSNDSAVSVSYGRGVRRPLALGRLDKRALSVR